METKALLGDDMQVTDYIDRLVARSLGQSYLVRPRNPSIFEDQIFHAGSADDDSFGTMRSQQAHRWMKTDDDSIRQIESNEDLADSKTHHSNSRKRSDLNELREELRHYSSDAAPPSAPFRIEAIEVDNSKSISSNTILPNSIPSNSIYPSPTSPEAVSSMPISSKSVFSSPIAHESDSHIAISPESTSQSPVYSALKSPVKPNISLQTKRKKSQSHKPDNGQASKNDANMGFDKSRTVLPLDHEGFGKMADPSNTGKTAARRESNMDLERAYIKRANAVRSEDTASRELNDLLSQSLLVQSQLAEAFRLSVQPANKPRSEDDVEKNIQVTIGRVEVRAVPERANPARQKPVPIVRSSLEEYLKKPKRGGR